MNALADEAVNSGVTHLFIERDESLIDADRKILAEVLRREKHSHLKYQHASPHEYPLLWVSDAVAWSFSKGKDWAQRAHPLIGNRIIKV
ncbi:MAG: hypothetical protein WBA28_09125 [Microbacteriaceae bacterium]